MLNRNKVLLDVFQKDLSGQDAVLRIQQNELLENYYHSIRSYLSLSEKPNEQLLILKFEELLLSLFSNKKHRELTDYFISLCQNEKFQMSRVMEENFGYNLKIEDYAMLCHMGLSTFKKTFKQYYNTTPAAWLLQRKLDLAYHKVMRSDLDINRISFECGFEDVSHFIRVFKRKNDLTPLQYRKKYSKAPQSET